MLGDPTWIVIPARTVANFGDVRHSTPVALAYVEHLKAFWMGGSRIEAIISKRADNAYRSGPIDCLSEDQVRAEPHLRGCGLRSR